MALPHRLRRLGRAALLVGALALLAPAGAFAQPTMWQGAWVIDGRAAVQLYDCNGLVCGRILWLLVPRDVAGQLDRDKDNPDPRLRQRQLCGLTILWNLHPAGRNRWQDGWFYNPDDGDTYRVSAQLESEDVLKARIYVGMPLFGRTKILVRVPHGVTKGWC